MSDLILLSVVIAAVGAALGAFDPKPIDWKAQVSDPDSETWPS
jgi:hypothetical protein